jgi:hypothetical protein
MPKPKKKSDARRDEKARTLITVTITVRLPKGEQTKPNTSAWDDRLGDAERYACEVEHLTKDEAERNDVAIQVDWEYA